MEVGDAEIRKFERVIEYNSKFRTMINHYYRPNKFKEFALNQQESLIVENNTFSETDEKENIRATFPSLSQSSITLGKKIS